MQIFRTGQDFFEGTLTELRERLEQLGKALQMEDQELARMGGVVKQTYSSYKSGQSMPRFDVLQRWARDLGVNANWLLLGEEPMFRNPALVLEQEKASKSQTTDPMVFRSERIAELMEKYGAPPEQIREAIMTTIKSTPQDIGEPRPVYSVQEADPPYSSHK